MVMKWARTPFWVYYECISVNFRNISDNDLDLRLFLFNARPMLIRCSSNAHPIFFCLFSLNALREHFAWILNTFQLTFETSLNVLDLDLNTFKAILKICMQRVKLSTLRAASVQPLIAVSQMGRLHMKG